MFIPYRCDAPLYYRPYGTVGLIVSNSLIFLGHFTGVLPQKPWMLEYGNGLHPEEWLLCNFAHIDFGHLLGNMVFLWVFGLVVEGKLGWLRFLSVYLAIGLAYAMIDQTIKLGYVGDVEGGMGASAAIFGVMAMACVWAPANEISVFVWIGWVIHFTFDVSVGLLSAFYISWEAVLALWLGTLSSSWLHVLGVLIGAPLGVIMLKRGVVDCEDWDLFSVLSGDYGPYAKEKRDAQPMDENKLQQRREQKQQEETRRFDAYLSIGKPLEALAVKRRMADLGCPLLLTADQLLRLIIALHKAGAWAESAPAMAEYLGAHSDRANLVRIKLAQICVQKLSRPQKALEVLAGLDRGTLAPDEASLFKQVAIAAQQQVQAGAIELDDTPW